MCTFWTSQLPKTLGKWSTFDILASKGASRHSSSVQFYLSPPTRWLRTHRCTEATFLPHWPSFYWLSLLWLFLFSDLLSADSLFCDTFSSLTVRTTAAASLHVGNLASKLPSTNISNTIILTNPYHAIHNAPFDRCLPSIVQRCSKYQHDIHRTRMKASYGFGVGLMHDDSYHQVFVRSGRQVACTVKQFLKT